jgi:transcription elongation factor Elf1
VTRTSLSRTARQPFAHAAPLEQAFTCVHCGLPVSCAPAAAGVLNRNHCPVCLWSRHMDWRAAGDRLSTCRAPMEPVGLTTKRSRNKYARERDGELMLVHRCAGCGKLVINRVAADDDAEAILALFERSRALAGALAADLAADGVTPLGPGDGELLRRRLFGAAGPLAPLAPLEW